MITHKFEFPYIYRKNINGTRHYVLPNGSVVPSVTSILSKTKSERDKQCLENWRIREGRERAAQITEEAASRGTSMHGYLEEFITKDTMTLDETSQQSYKMASVIKENAFHENCEYYAVEAYLYCDGLYSGATDLIYSDNGKLTIGDFKQANKPKRTEWITDYFLQVAAYKICFEEMYGEKIEQAKIMMCSVDLQYQEWLLKIDELDRYEKMFADRLELYYRNEG